MFDRNYWNSFEFSNFHFVFLLITIKTQISNWRIQIRNWISVLSRGNRARDDVQVKNNLNIISDRIKKIIFEIFDRDIQSLEFNSIHSNLRNLTSFTHCD